LFTPRTPPDRMEAVEDVFRSEGIAFDRRVVAPPPIGNGIGWYLEVLVLSAIGNFLSHYFGIPEAAGAARERTAQQMRAFIDRLREVYAKGYPKWRVRRREFELILKDPSSNAQVSIRSSMSDKGFRKLLEVEFEPGASYVWDESSGEWQAWEEIEGDLVMREPSVDSAPTTPAKPRLRDRLRRLLGR
jgi:hypothetical protein